MHPQGIRALKDRLARGQDVSRRVEIAVMARAARGTSPLALAQAQRPMQVSVRTTERAIQGDDSTSSEGS